jgi:hypothetical protein
MNSVHAYPPQYCGLPLEINGLYIIVETESIGMDEYPDFGIVRRRFCIYSIDWREGKEGETWIITICWLV